MTELALGIDIGGTNTAWGLVDRTGQILTGGSVPTRGDADAAAYVTRVSDSIKFSIGNPENQEIVGIGIGAPNGNFYTGEIVFAPNMPWHGVIPMAKLFSEAFGIKAALTNDANAAAIGEMQYGIAKNMRDFILVTLGTGLGSGFVANGQLIYGRDGFAGELGHVIAERGGRLCGCGRRGCLERYASATGITLTAEQWLDERYTPSALRENKGSITAAMIHEAAVAGDELALEIFDYTGRILGESLGDAVAITSPEAIIFFGGVAAAGDYLLKPVKHYLEANLLHIYQNKVKLLLSALPGNDAAILGASALVWQ